MEKELKICGLCQKDEAVVSRDPEGWDVVCMNCMMSLGRLVMKQETREKAVDLWNRIP